MPIIVYLGRWIKRRHEGREKCKSETASAVSRINVVRNKSRLVTNILASIWVAEKGARAQREELIFF